MLIENAMGGITFTSKHIGCCKLVVYKFIIISLRQGWTQEAPVCSYLLQTVVGVFCFFL